MSHRWLIPLSAVLTAAALGAWMRPEANSSAAAPAGTVPAVSRTDLFEPNQFYAVEGSRQGGSFDVVLDGASDYELIVSSLGDGTRTYQVRLSATDLSPLPAGEGPDVKGAAKQASVCLVPRLCLGTHCRRGSASIGSPTDGPSFSTASGAHPPSRSQAEPGNEMCTCCRRGLVRDSGPLEALSTGDSGPTATKAALQRRFFLHAGAGALEDERAYVPLIGVLAAEGSGVRVYVDRELSPSALEPGLTDQIVRLLDEQIIPASRLLIGEHSDVDGDGKLAVLVTAWLDRLAGGKTSIQGLVQSNDFRSDLEPPFGNRADVLFLNATWQTRPGLKTVLAHEYTHAVCFSRRLVRAGAVPLPEEDWLSEAIAHLAETEIAGDWSNLDHRIAEFLAAPQKSPLVIRDYYRAGLWRDPGCRGATYLFLRYCADEFGLPVLRELVEGTAGGTENVEQATGIPFPELFRRWTIALAEGRIRSLSLRGPLGKCNLAGIRRIEWPADRERCELDLCGTATSLVRIPGVGRRGLLRVSVQADRGAALQMSVARRLEFRL